MTLPCQEHNSLLATREFLSILSNSDEIPERFKLNAQYLLKDYPTRLKLDELYKGSTYGDLMQNDSTSQSSNKIVNNNQTWETPGFKWKTEVEFVPAKQT